MCSQEGEEEMNYQEWTDGVPETIQQDALWRMKAYRLALFVGDIGWHDVTKLMRDQRTIALSDQLYRALGSTSANIAEGYSRGTGKDRARFYEYALGSARESRDWYYKGRHILHDEITQHRLQLLSEIIRLLLTIIPKQRGRTLREPDAHYHIAPETDDLDHLLANVPLPEP